MVIYLTDEKKIMLILKEKGEMSTTELEQEFNRRGEDCPDGVVRILMRSKMKGVINGRMDTSRKGWVWSIKDQS
jgi:repressor of nif and glnA expression